MQLPSLDMDARNKITANTVRSKRLRTLNACDRCKASKVKCDGKLPCSHCRDRRGTEACQYTIPRRRRPPLPLQCQKQRSRPTSASRPRSLPDPTSHEVYQPADDTLHSIVVGAEATPQGSAVPSPLPAIHTELEAPASARRRESPGVVPDENTEVPLEAQLLCGIRDNMIFLGDCASLSFLQLVRQLITTHVGQNPFELQASQHSVLEIAAAQHPSSQLHGHVGPPDTRSINIISAVSAYQSATTGLVDMFDNTKLVDELLLWATTDHQPNDMSSLVNFLILAIGLQTENSELSKVFFEYARNQAYRNFDSNFTTEAVKVFTLITIYLLCSCQTNSAFLCFGLAVRIAYSVGLHRNEINARFGLDMQRQRDRLWKSLRVVDICLSSLLGRPAAGASADGTISCQSQDAEVNADFDLLHASIQALVITEDIILQIYSLKKISLQLIEGISRRLRDWSVRWLPCLQGIITQSSGQNDSPPSGACHVLTSYHYSIMLVCRPFLIDELNRHLSRNSTSATRSAPTSGKSKLADACIDGAILMVDCITDLIGRNQLNGKAPLLVLRLFAASLMLGIGIFGGFGRTLEQCTRTSIQALDHFATSDSHAAEYSLIAQSLLTTALDYLDRCELQKRLQSTKNTSLLFGLAPTDAWQIGDSPSQQQPQLTDTESLQRSLDMEGDPLGDIHSAFQEIAERFPSGLNAGDWSPNLWQDRDLGSSLNLFPW